MSGRRDAATSRRGSAVHTDAVTSGCQVGHLARPTADWPDVRPSTANCRRCALSNPPSTDALTIRRALRRSSSRSTSVSRTHDRRSLDRDAPRPSEESTGRLTNAQASGADRCALHQSVRRTTGSNQPARTPRLSSSSKRCTCQSSGGTRKGERAGRDQESIALEILARAPARAARRRRCGGPRLASGVPNPDADADPDPDAGADRPARLAADQHQHRTGPTACPATPCPPTPGRACRPPAR